MQHILFKIFNRRFSWKMAKSYDDRGQTEILRMPNGSSTKKLTSVDFNDLAKAMDKAGVKTVRFCSIENKIYIVLND